MNITLGKVKSNDKLAQLRPLLHAALWVHRGDKDEAEMLDTLRRVARRASNIMDGDDSAVDKRISLESRE